MKVLKPLTIAFRTILLLGLAVAAQNVIAAQTPSVKAKIDPMTVPDITVQSEDYAVARSHFHTNLLQTDFPPSPPGLRLVSRPCVRSSAATSINSLPANPPSAPSSVCSLS